MNRAMPAMLVGLIVPAVLYTYLVARPGLILAIVSGTALAVFCAGLTPAARRTIGPAPFVIAIGLPLAAWLAPGLWGLIAVMALLVPVLARSGAHAASLYVFALLLLPPLDRTLALGGVKLFDFGLHDALAGGAAMTLLLRRGWRAPMRVALDLPVLALLAMLVFVFARGTSATNVVRVAVDIGLDCALPYFIVSRGLRTGEDVLRWMLHLAAAATIIACILPLEVWTAWPIYNVLYDRYAVDLLLIVKNRGGLLRAGGPFLESTSIAMVLVFCFLALWLARGAFRTRAAHLGLMAVVLVGIAAPQSRGAWLGLFVSMALIDVYRRNWRRAATRCAIVGTAALSLLGVARMNLQWSEMAGLSGSSADSSDYRQRLFDRGLEEIARRPWTGHSRTDLLTSLSDMVQGEGIIDFVNTHLYMALLGGLPGLALFNGVFLAYLWQCWRARDRLSPSAATGATFAFGALLTPLQMLLFTSMGGRVQVFVFLFLALGAVIGRQRRAAAYSSGTSHVLASRPAATPMPPAPISSISSLGSNSPIRASAVQQ